MENQFKVYAPANARFFVHTRANVKAVLGEYHFNDWVGISGSAPSKLLTDGRGNVVYQPNGLPYIAPDDGARLTPWPIVAAHRVTFLRSASTEVDAGEAIQASPVQNAVYHIFDSFDDEHMSSFPNF